MPTSKKRKKAVVKKRIPRAEVRLKTAGGTAKDKWTIKLHASHIIQLRNDPDFLTMIKIGRVTNALSFCLHELIANGEERTLKEKLQHRRAAAVLGGYVHEAVTVVDRIKGPYLGVEAFEPLRELVVEAKHRKIRRYARKMRNYMAFHLDELDVSTQRSLANLELTTHTIMAADMNEQPVPAYYFELADYLDMAFLVEEFADGRTWKETTEDIVWGINNYAAEFIGACHTFQQWLWKTKFAKHAY